MRVIRFNSPFVEVMMVRFTRSQLTETQLGRLARISWCVEINVVTMARVHQTGFG